MTAPTHLGNQARLTPQAEQALTQTRRALTAPPYWLAMALVILGLAGIDPSGIDGLLPLPGRLAYWASLVAGSALVMTVLSVMGRVLGAGGDVPAPILWLGVGIAGIVPVTALVHWVNQLVGRIGPDVTMADIFVYVGPIVLGLTLALNALHCRITSGGFEAMVPTDKPDADRDGQQTRAMPALLFHRLPRALGTEVVCLRARDHYLDVTTTRGQVTMLMRLRDAEQDLTADFGMRVHRSWWVDLRYVQSSEVEGSSLVLCLQGGLRVPVARAQRAAVQAALGVIRDAREIPRRADRSAGHPPAA